MYIYESEYLYLATYEYIDELVSLIHSSLEDKFYYMIMIVNVINLSHSIVEYYRYYYDEHNVEH